LILYYSQCRVPALLILIHLLNPCLIVNLIRLWLITGNVVAKFCPLRQHLTYRNLVRVTTTKTKIKKTVALMKKCPILMLGYPNGALTHSGMHLSMKLGGKRENGVVSSTC
jgi:hypothetical protein